MQSIHECPYQVEYFVTMLYLAVFEREKKNCVISAALTVWEDTTASFIVGSLNSDWVALGLWLLA